MSFQSIDINNVDFNELNKYFSDFIEENDANNSVSVTGNNKKKSHRTDNECSNCDGTNFVEDYSQGIVICTKCGEVLRTIFDQNPEWKQYDDDDKAGARCNQVFNVLLPQSSLGTSIGGYVNSRTKRLHGWVQMPYKERSLNNEFKIIHEICQKAGILKCVEDDTKIMYKMASECKHQTGPKAGKQVITRGVNRKSIVAACLFFACVRKGITRTSKEIALLWGINESDMNKGRRNLQKLFKIKDKAKKAMLNTETSKPEHFIKRYCNSLQIKNQYVDDALRIAINVEKLNITSSHTPCSSAAASILLMAEINKLEHITKKKLASQFEISDSTIFKTYKEMEPYKHILTNNESTNEIISQIDKDMVVQEIPEEVIERMKKFGIEHTQHTKQTKTNQSQKSSKSPKPVKSTKKNSSKDLKKSKNSEEYSDSDLSDLEEDDDIEDNEYFYEDDSSDTNDINVLNSAIEENLQSKFALINKIIKNKSLKDLKEEMKILMTSYDLIKGIRKDLDQYAKNNSIN